MAFTTTALGLTIWNSPSDKYNYQQLADNWLRVDEHDHTPGKGNLIQTDSIANGAITSAKIAPGVISANVQARSVGTEALIDRAVTTSKLGNGSVNNNKLHPHSRLPIGTIVPWWHPNPTDETLVSLFGVESQGQVVPGWVICDGRILPPGSQDFVNTEFTVPNLQSKFVMGASGTVASGTSTITNLTATTSGGSRTFTLNSTSGLLPNRTYLISAPTIFGANTTFTTDSSLSTSQVASNTAKITASNVSAVITTNPNAATTTGGVNTVSLAHSHSFSHTHTVPAHHHFVSAMTEDTNHSHSAPSGRAFVRKAAGDGENSNFDRKSGEPHRFTSSVSTGPIRGNKTTYSVSGTAGWSFTINGDANFTSGPPNSLNTAESLSDIDNRPNYVAVTYIMKVKN